MSPDKSQPSGGAAPDAVPKVVFLTARDDNYSFYPFLTPCKDNYSFYPFLASCKDFYPFLHRETQYMGPSNAFQQIIHSCIVCRVLSAYQKVNSLKLQEPMFLRLLTFLSATGQKNPAQVSSQCKNILIRFGFLLDPGMPGVRSMGPSLSKSLHTTPC